MNKKELIQAFESNRDVCAKENVPAWDWAIKLAQMLPDDQPQEPCIPVSVIRNEIDRRMRLYVDCMSAYNKGGADVYKEIKDWLDLQVQLTAPQPEPSDGWAIWLSGLARNLKDDSEVWIRKSSGAELYRVFLVIGDDDEEIIGTRFTIDKAKALADEFAEANGGWE